MHSIGAADLLLDRAVERAMAAHHLYRPGLAGSRRWSRHDASPWCREKPAPREDCAIDVLIDGVEMLPAIAEAMGDARRSVRALRAPDARVKSVPPLAR